MKKEATLKVSACYFPVVGEVDLTFEDIKTGEMVAFTCKIPQADGERLAELVPCGVYHYAREG